MNTCVPAPLPNLHVKLTHVSTIIVVAGTIISFIPLILVGSSNKLNGITGPSPDIHSGTYTGDDYLSSNTPIVYSPFCRESLIASLAIGIPFFLDLLLDLFATRSFKDYLDGGKTSDTVRMNLVERSFFIVGVLMSGLTSIAPVNTHFDVIIALWAASTNVTTFLCIAPLFIFLERISTNVRNPKQQMEQTLIAVVCVTMVGILGSWQTIQLPSSAPSYHTITLVCLILIVVIMAVFVNNLANQSMKHLRKIWNDTAAVTPDNYHGTMDETSTFAIRTPYERINDGWKQLRRQFELNYAVIWVSFALLVVITSNVWFYIDNYVGSFSNYRYGFYNYIKMMANAVVLVVEMRIRTNEVKSGLDVIESRRAFVRFVSHEVRTPLSTAIMGLQLLLEESSEEQAAAAAAAAVVAVGSVATTNAAASLNTRRQEHKDMLR